MASVLVVCTGNVCRSPMAEGLLRSALEDRLGDRAPAVRSAGTVGWEGAPAMPESIQAAKERGVDISDHVVRRLSGPMVVEADLVLVMAEEHREAVADLLLKAPIKTFTLKELVRLLEALPPAPPGPPDEVLRERVLEAHRLRRSGFQGNPFDQDIADPLGMPLASYRAVVWELEEWCRRLVGGLYGMPGRI